jgi:hypothetical protein
MELKDLKLYTIINASESELLVNWPFNKRVTFRFFFAGRKALSLKNFIIENDLFDYFFFIEENVYYSFQNKKLLKLTAISYPNLVACAIYRALLDLEKEEVLEIGYVYWAEMLDNLLSPLIHYKILNILKKNKFFEKYSFVIIRSFISRLNIPTYTHYFWFHPESRDVNLFYNILTCVGIDDKKALTLAQNCIATNNLNEIKSHLESLYDKEKKLKNKY